MEQQQIWRLVAMGSETRRNAYSNSDTGDPAALDADPSKFLAGTVLYNTEFYK
jgi:hypothetical protein